VIRFFKYHIEDDKEEQLTTDLFAVNYIFPTSNKIFFVGKLKNSRIIKLGSIDNETKSISYWQDDGDINVETFVINHTNREIYISAYSNAEMQYNLEHQGEIPGKLGFLPMAKEYMSFLQ